MSTLNKYFNARINPFTGEKEPKHIVAGDANSDYPFLQSPATYNAPENAPVRVEVELPEIPDLSDTVNRPFLLYKDSIAPANRLTQVSGEPTTDNTYRVGLPGLERSHCLQLSENLMDTPIYFDYYGLGTVINKNNLENLIVDYLKVNNDVECKNDLNVLETLKIKEIQSNQTAPNDFIKFLSTLKSNSGDVEISDTEIKTAQVEVSQYCNLIKTVYFSVNSDRMIAHYLFPTGFTKDNCDILISYRDNLISDVKWRIFSNKYTLSVYNGVDELKFEIPPEAILEPEFGITIYDCTFRCTFLKRAPLSIPIA